MGWVERSREGVRGLARGSPWLRVARGMVDVLEHHISDVIYEYRPYIYRIGSDAVQLMMEIINQWRYM